ncbi:MAG: SET domain-containing protein [Chitinophagaceae bacterium]|jgi:SET domain-containing protein|nr:SET domain-containing protein [Sediminibacterium sp.]
MPYIYGMILPFLTIASSSNRGRGVFTTEKIEKGTIIEIAPVIVLNPEERAHVEKTLLYDYIFEWGTDHQSAAVALGYVSIYNHIADPNCAYQMDFEEQTITITTIKDILIGEELLINYMNPEGASDKSVWFDTF